MLLCISHPMRESESGNANRSSTRLNYSLMDTNGKHSHPKGNNDKEQEI